MAALEESRARSRHVYAALCELPVTAHYGRIDLLDELIDLAERHPTDPELAGYVAAGASKIVPFHPNEDEVQRLSFILEDYANRRYEVEPGDTSDTDYFVAAAASEGLVHSASRSSAGPEAYGKLIRQLRMLNRAHPRSDEIAARLVTALLAQFGEELADPGEVREAVEEAGRVAGRTYQEWSPQPFNIAWAFRGFVGRADVPPFLAQLAVDKFEEFNRQLGDHQDVAGMWAEAVCLLLQRDGSRHLRATYLAALKELVDKYPDDMKIGQAYVWIQTQQRSHSER